MVDEVYALLTNSFLDIIETDRSIEMDAYMSIRRSDVDLL